MLLGAHRILDCAQVGRLPVAHLGRRARQLMLLVARPVLELLSVVHARLGSMLLRLFRALVFDHSDLSVRFKLLLLYVAAVSILVEEVVILELICCRTWHNRVRRYIEELGFGATSCLEEGSIGNGAPRWLLCDR